MDAIEIKAEEQATEGPRASQGHGPALGIQMGLKALKKRVWRRREREKKWMWRRRRRRRRTCWNVDD